MVPKSIPLLSVVEDLGVTGKVSHVKSFVRCIVSIACDKVVVVSVDRGHTIPCEDYGRERKVRRLIPVGAELENLL